MSLALSKGTCGRTFEMANQNDGRVILCRRRASGRHHMDKTGRKTGNQWATKAGNDKEDTYTMVCILLKSIGAPGRNRTHGPQLRRLLLYPAELLAQTRQRRSIKQGFPEVKPDLARFARLGKGRRHEPERAGASRRRIHGRKGASAIAFRLTVGYPLCTLRRVWSMAFTFSE